MDDGSPLNDRHVAFAKALIGLCREHGANHVSVRFQLTGSKLWSPGEERWSDANVAFDWAEGRYGAKARALLKAETHLSIEEPDNG